MSSATLAPPRSIGTPIAYLTVALLLSHGGIEKGSVMARNWATLERLRYRTVCSKE
jgi:hypothetical protein